MNNDDLIVLETDKWDKEFFKDFSDFRNSLYENESIFEKESIQSLSKVFNSDEVKNNYFFSAFLIKNERETIARIAFFTHKEKFHYLTFGYFESLPITPTVKLEQLISKMENKYKSTRITGPVNASIFLSYRIKSSEEKSFHSEPTYKNYYHDIFKELGFGVFKEWSSYKIDNSKKTFKDFKNIQKKNQQEKLTVKFLLPWRWDNYIEKIYFLFLKSYDKMEGFQFISLEFFKSHYDDFKYFLNPFFSYLVFNSEKKPVGFCINYFDPSHILNDYKEDLGFFEKIILRARLLLNTKRLLLVYVGKDSSLTKGKGFQSVISPYLKFFVFFFRPKEAFICFQEKKSRSKRSFDQQNQTEVSRYYLYSKKVKN